MNRLSYLILFYLGAVLFLAIGMVSPQDVVAQSVSKISVAKRAGNAGYVIRLHMNRAPKSFDLAQPNLNGLEILLNDSKASLSKLNTKNFNYPIRYVRKVDVKGGAGLVLEIDPNEQFTSRIYLDANKKDILIALSSTTKQTASDFALSQKGFGWIDPIQAPPVADIKPVSQTNPIGSPVTTTGNGRTRDISEDEAVALSTANDTYRRLRDNVKFDVVVIDAGHGGHDSGAIGYAKNREKDIALKTALKLGELIEKNMPDVKVVYTRQDDRFITLAERGKIANRAQGDLFISIHCNAARNRAAYGAEIFFMGQHRSDDALDVMLAENSVVKLEESTPDVMQMSPDQLLAYELANIGNIASSEKIASYMIDEFIHYAKRPSRGVKQAGFWVLYHASMPAVLVELGFISNKNEEAYLITNQAQNELAEAMYKGVKSYRDQYEKSLNLAEPVPVINVSGQ